MALGKVENAKDPTLKILVVDDDELNRRMMKILLSREGHQVDLVSNGMDALDAVKYQRFDIVFMDLQMPTMDGIEASRRIREWENGGMHTYIVALTASYLPEEGQRLFEAGIDNYISKPFEFDHIQRMLSLISKTPQPSLSASLDKVNPSKDNQVLDTQMGTQRVGGDVETYRELLSDFIQNLSKRIATMEKYLLERDMEAFARDVHNLKGVSLNLGAMELAQHASELDKHSNGGYTRQHEGLFSNLKIAETNLLRTANDFLSRQGRFVGQT